MALNKELLQCHTFLFLVSCMEELLKEEPPEQMNHFNAKTLIPATALVASLQIRFCTISNLSWGPYQNKNFDQLFIQIGPLVPPEWIFKVGLKKLMCAFLYIFFVFLI